MNKTEPRRSSRLAVTRKKSQSPSPQKPKKNKTRSPPHRSPPRRSNTAPYFEPQERWKNGKPKYFCGVHAFNNLIGRPDAITKEHIYRVCADIPRNTRVTPCDKRIGNFLNEILVAAINQHPDNLYSAYQDLMFLTDPSLFTAENQLIYEEENTAILEEPAIIERVAESGGLIQNLYKIFLKMAQNMDKFIGLIIQINEGDIGHYVALRKMDPAGQTVKIIDSMAPQGYDTYPNLNFYNDRPAIFRSNCAKIIDAILGLGDEDEPAILQFIIVVKN